MSKHHYLQFDDESIPIPDWHHLTVVCSAPTVIIVDLDGEEIKVAVDERQVQFEHRTYLTGERKA